MATLVYLIEQLAAGLYILIAVAIIVIWRNYLDARRGYRSSNFAMMRDESRFRQANALTILGILLEVALVVLGIQRVVAPAVRAADPNRITLEQVIADGDFITSTPAPASGGIVIDSSTVNLFPTDPADVVFATPTLTPTPVGTILPNAPPVSGCDTPEATLQIPANGMRVFEPINVIGTANVADFAYFRIEISGPSTLGQFRILSQNTISVPEIGGLGNFVPISYEPGEYRFRITVFDNTNTPRAACMVNITITEPPPVPTPVGE